MIAKQVTEEEQKQQETDLTKTDETANENEDPVQFKSKLMAYEIQE